MEPVKTFAAIARALPALMLVVASALAPAAHANAFLLWEDVTPASIETRGERQIRPQKFRTVALKAKALERALAGVTSSSTGAPGAIVALPMPDGTFLDFEVFTTPVMAPGLAKRFDDIRTYAGRAVNDRHSWVRLDVTPAGFHAMLHTLQGTVYIDPYQREAGRVVDHVYQVYAKHDLSRSVDRAFKCDVHDHRPVDDVPAGASRTPTGPTLRTYRLAVATTGEYAQFHGGTVSLVLAEIVTAINRVNGIYESQLAIRMELIANNDQIIFTNAATDGYTNNNGVALLGQNQARLDSVIGSANYDIGHVFSTGGGGIAGLGVVCRANNKARGVTGLPSPVGDPFYVDFVAHEIGHQFGGNHTFNGTAAACGGANRNGSTAYEPGSGSTIMAYAGICGSHNIATRSEEHFHTESFDEIVSYSNFGAGNACAVRIATGNQAPVVDAGTSFTLPLDTPFRLTGSAVDPDGDPLVYRWEQYDLGPGGSPQSPTGNAPLFRSLPAENDPTRVLPRLNDILTDSQTVGERLPDYSRAMRFRLTAQDLRLGGGGVDNDDVQHFVTQLAGPFDVTSQNITTIWTPFETETITWDVANTDQSPVNCANVNILFSADVGNTFDTVLSAATPNDGSEDVIVPNIQTNAGRVQVECADNLFFDINNVNIRVLEPVNPDFTVAVVEPSVAACAPDTAQVTVDVGSIAGFTDPVSLSVGGAPSGVLAVFGVNPIAAGGSTTLTLDNLGAAAPGDYVVTVNGNGSTGSRSDTFELEVGPGLPGEALLTSPADGATGVLVSPTLSWQPAANAADYLLEIATDAAFNDIVYSAEEVSTSHVVDLSLNPTTDYFWRVTARNFCGNTVSTTASFTTAVGPAIVCATPNATIPETGAPLVSTVEVTSVGTITDVNATLTAAHGTSGHLVATLTHAQSGTTVTLMDQPGNDFFPGGCPVPDIDARFDDAASLEAELTCNPSPPALGPSVRPDEALAVFNGEAAAGDWSLTMSDATPGTVGVLAEWCVEVSFDPPTVIDTDGDGVGDDVDNCTLLANADQRDTNGDGFGNVCDADLNNDGVINFVDLGLLRAVFFSADPDADFNGDGVVNVLDLGVLRGAFFGPPGPSATP
ncbi:MAG: reprolysin-like metallopeptidase [Pseudomonadota bacterium]